MERSVAVMTGRSGVGRKGELGRILQGVRPPLGVLWRRTQTLETSGVGGEGRRMNDGGGVGGLKNHAMHFQLYVVL